MRTSGDVWCDRWRLLNGENGPHGLVAPVGAVQADAASTELATVISPSLAHAGVEDFYSLTLGVPVFAPPAEGRSDLPYQVRARVSWGQEIARHVAFLDWGQVVGFSTHALQVDALWLNTGTAPPAVTFAAGLGPGVGGFSEPHVTDFLVFDPETSLSALTPIPPFADRACATVDTFGQTVDLEIYAHALAATPYAVKRFDANQLGYDWSVPGFGRFYRLRGTGEGAPTQAACKWYLRI